MITSRVRIGAELPRAVDSPAYSASSVTSAAVDGAAVQEALQLTFSDFEDAVTAAAARLAGCGRSVGSARPAAGTTAPNVQPPAKAKAEIVEDAAGNTLSVTLPGKQ